MIHAYVSTHTHAHTRTYAHTHWRLLVSLGDMQLKTLTLQSFISLDAVPASIGRLTSLEILHIHATHCRSYSLQELLASMVALTNLRKLSICHCAVKAVKELPFLGQFSEKFDTRKSRSTRRLAGLDRADDVARDLVH